MNKNNKKLRALTFGVVMSLGFILPGCSTTPVAAPTPYQSASTENGYGYSSEMLQDNTYRVLFKATDKTPADKVQQYTLYRAAEIAQKKGFTYLSIEKSHVEQKPTLAREVITTKDKPDLFKTDQQCTMSGCSEVAAPLEASTSNTVVNTHINNVYFTIVVKMGNKSDSLGANAFAVKDILSEPLEPIK